MTFVRLELPAADIRIDFFYAFVSDDDMIEEDLFF